MENQGKHIVNIVFEPVTLLDYILDVTQFQFLCISFEHETKTRC